VSPFARITLGKTSHARKYLSEDCAKLFILLDMYQNKTPVCLQSTKNALSCNEFVYLSCIMYAG